MEIPFEEARAASRKSIREITLHLANDDVSVDTYVHSFQVTPYRHLLPFDENDETCKMMCLGWWYVGIVSADRGDAKSYRKHLRGLLDTAMGPTENPHEWAPWLLSKQSMASLFGLLLRESHRAWLERNPE